MPVVCSCGTIGRTDLRQCPEHFSLWMGDRRLTSVGRIVGASFPLDPSIPAETLENARDRGEEVDALFGAYVRGELTSIPAGTRQDAYDLFLKAKEWFDRKTFKTVDTQVVLGDGDYGGVVDFMFDGCAFDLKATYKVEESARLQVAGYVTLTDKDGGYVLHVTERQKEAKLIWIDLQDIRDFQLCLEHYRMLSRRAPKRLTTEASEPILI